jgi:glutamate 5-kinase
MENIRRDIIAQTKKILVKIGSAVLTGSDGLDLGVINDLVGQMADLIKRGYSVILVTSGAIVSGKHRLKLTKKLKSIPEKQAAAAVGQGRLMRVYSKAFEKNGLFVAQILLTLSDLTDRRRFLNIRNTLSILTEWQAIPIINENDTVAFDEIKFGDNDNLAAMVANIVEADLFINLTSLDGLFDKNPATSKKAKFIPLVTEFTPEIEAMATEETSAPGTGGMKSKIMAAKKVTAMGIPCIIAPGKRKNVLTDILAGKEIGTLFLPETNRLNSKKHWIAFTLKSKGRLILDDGAEKAILEQGKSLLPSGIMDVEGHFNHGDPVSCINRNGVMLAKGLVNYSSDEIKKIKGLKTTDIGHLLGYKDYDEVIHRNNMVIPGQHYKK